MTEVMTSEGMVSRADAARIHFAKHYAIMRKYHTQLTRIKNRTISKNNKTGRTDIVNIGLHFILKNVRPYAASCSEA